ncbi:MAG: tripartite tricarboxylate transporter substrate binding protein [Zoogloeaceae bacterium]|jgi:tripartite-type tricarboxylate transporter receptor subunit TctC|nr:tripartite tricarboxylate transporter substrate binding protein [Zoogloeaceae bacterium]
MQKHQHQISGIVRRAVSMLTCVFAVSLAGLYLGGIACAAEEAWPTRQITLVVPWSPGGSSDAFARIVAQELSVTLGQPVIVENRPGATGTIGVRHVARSKPDGYTFLFGNTVSMIGSVVSASTPVQFDPLQDFVPVALVVETYYILTAHPSAGVKNFREFLAWAQDPAKPPLAVGSTGNGATSDILYDYLIHKRKANLTKVAFKGTGPLVTDLIAGHLPVGSAALSLVASHYRDGKLFPLVIVGKNRLPQLPNVPSVQEFGLTAPDLSVWDGVFAPAGTPPAIVSAFAAALKKANQSAAFKDLAEKNGSIVVFNSGADAAARLKKDLEERQRFKADIEQAQ